jgi:UDP-N-acetylglucosamine diphosphorylase/glucosamine-1-phosphate N-acetyltransferase
VSAVFLYDDAHARDFQPFALTRPVGELRAGALLVRERWARALGSAPSAHLTSAHLEGFTEAGAADVPGRVTIPAGSWIANARFSPSLRAVPPGNVIVADGRVAAVRILTDLTSERFSDGRLSLEELVEGRSATTAAGWWMEEVWDYVRHLTVMLGEDIPILGAELSTISPRDAIRLGDQAIYVEDGATVEPNVCFDTTAGPILLRATSHVQSFTRLVGPLYVGAQSLITTDRVSGSSIGDTCKVHGEMNAAILIGHANKGHHGFVGHSIFGRWVNLGAGTTTSNMKNTYGPVQLWTPTGMRDTGMQFLGTMFGDHAKTGIGLQLTTGCVLGAAANVWGAESPSKVVAPFSWGETGGGDFQTYRIEKMLEVAERMMFRREVTLDEAMKRQLRASFDARWTVDE